jgi:hypothetical protein
VKFATDGKKPPLCAVMSEKGMQFVCFPYCTETEKTVASVDCLVLPELPLFFTMNPMNNMTTTIDFPGVNWYLLALILLWTNNDDMVHLYRGKWGKKEQIVLPGATKKAALETHIQSRSEQMLEEKKAAERRVKAAEAGKKAAEEAKKAAMAAKKAAEAAKKAAERREEEEKTKRVAAERTAEEERTKRMEQLKQITTRQNEISCFVEAFIEQGRITLGMQNPRWSGQMLHFDWLLPSDVWRATHAREPVRSQTCGIRRPVKYDCLTSLSVAGK